MPIDNLTWQARVGTFNSSKPLFKTKIINRGMLQFLHHHTVYSIYSFLTFILITQVKNLNLICLAETFLNFSIRSDDSRITIDGYNLIRSNHPSDSKKGGVCIYYKEHIRLILRDDINTLDCLVTEIFHKIKNVFLLVFTIPQVKIRMSLKIFVLILI